MENEDLLPRFPDTQPFDPKRMAARALRSESDRRMVIANLRYLFRHHGSGPELVEQTGAQLCQMSGPQVLRQIAESAEQSDCDPIGNAVCYRLLSGFWRTGKDPAKRDIHGTAE